MPAIDFKIRASGEKDLDAALGKLEKKATSLQAKLNKLKLHAKVDLKLRGLATDMNAIQTAINKRLAIKPIYITARLRIDKRSVNMSLYNLQRRLKGIKTPSQAKDVPAKARSAGGVEHTKNWFGEPITLQKRTVGNWYAEQRKRDLAMEAVMASVREKAMQRQEKLNRWRSLGGTSLERNPATAAFRKEFSDLASRRISASNLMAYKGDPTLGNEITRAISEGFSLRTPEGRQRYIAESEANRLATQAAQKTVNMREQALKTAKSPENIWRRYDQQLQAVKLGEMPASLPLLQQNDAKNIEALGKNSEVASKQVKAHADQTGKLVNMQKRAVGMSKGTARDLEREGQAAEQGLARAAGMGGGGAATTGQDLTEKQKQLVDMEKKRAEFLKKNGVALNKNKKALDGSLLTRTDLNKVEMQALATYNKMAKSLTSQQSRMSDLEKLAMRRGDLEAKKKYEKARFAASDKQTALQDTISRKGVSGDEVYTSLGKYQRDVDRLEKDVKKWEKREQRLNKRRAGAMGGFFGKFSIYMSGIAASFFVFQEVAQIMRAFISTGSEFAKTLREISSVERLSAENTMLFNREMHALQGTYGFTVKEIAEANTELRNIGLGPEERMAHLADTIKLSRNPLLEMKDAAYLAAKDVDGLKESYLDVYDAMDKGAGAGWQRFKGGLREVATIFFEKNEPQFVKTLERFSTWADKNGDKLVDTLTGIYDIMEGLATISLEGLMGPILVLGDLMEGLKIYEYNKAGLINFDKAAQRAGEPLDPTKPDGRKVGMMPALREQIAAIETPKTDDEATLENLMNNREKAFWAYDEQQKRHNLRIQQMNEVMVQSWGMSYDMEKDPVLKVIDAKMENAKAELDRVDQAIAMLEKSNANQQKKTSKDTTLLTPTQIVTAHKEVYDKLGIATGHFLNDQQTEFEKGYAAIAKVVPQYMDQIKAHDAFEVKKLKVGPMLQEYKSYFQTVGTLPAEAQGEYLSIIHEQIKAEVDMMVYLDQKMKDSLIAIRTKSADNAINVAPYMERHESIFQDTGIQSDFMKAELQAQALKERNRMVKTFNIDATAADLWYNNKIAEINAQGFSKQLEAQRAFFDEYGIARDGYYELELQTLNDNRQRLAGIMGEAKADEYYAKWVKNLDSRMRQPSIDIYQEMFTETGVMQDEFYEHSKLAIEDWYEIQKEIIGESTALWETYSNKLEKLEADRLRNSPGTRDETWAGFRAGMIELKLESKSHANVVADTFKELANDIDNSFKTLFFDTMEGRFENFQDIAIGAFEAIRDAANEILYDILKNSIKQSATSGWIGAAIGGIGSLFGGSTGATTAGHPSGGVAMDTGGWLTEPVVGYGMNTGTRYTLAEKNPELVVNPRRGQTVGGGNSYAISVPVNVQGASNAQAARLQVMIEDTVRDFVREELS
jgi:hypothetical protein